MGRAVAVLLCVAAAAAGADELREARALLQGDRFADRCRGIDLLVKLDSDGAIRMLEESLRAFGRDLAAASRAVDSRDASWLAALVKVFRLEAEGRERTPEGQAARRRELELRMELEAATRRAEMLLRSIEAGGRALGRFNSPEAVARLEAGALREPDITIRLFEIAALGRPERRGSLPLLLSLLEQNDPRVRAGAARALIPLAREPGVTQRFLPLAGDPCWAVRLGVYQAMAAAPLPEAVEFLVGAAGHERGEMSLAVDSYLEELTGRSFPDAPAEWALWWKENAEAIRGGTYRRPDEAPAVERRTRATFFRIPIESEQVAFVLDFSASMSEEIDVKDPEIRRLLDRHGLAPTRLGYAQAEFIRAIHALPDGARFNVIGYSNAARALSRDLTVLDAQSRSRAIRWVVDLSSDDLTNLWDGLRTAFRDYLEGTAGASRFPELPDTIVFLTDGNATRGRFREADALRDLVRLWNLPVDAVLHTVGIGSDHDRGLLQGLAADTGGYYVDVEKGLEDLRPRRRALPEPARRVLRGE